MPYINPSERPVVDALINYDRLIGLTPGQVNYLLTRIIVRWMKSNLPYTSYASRSRAHGILQDVATEWYRRMIAPYEDQKCRDNGDVYE